MQYLLYILIIICLALLLALSFALSKLRKQQGEKPEIPEEDYKNSLGVIEDAQKQANAIVEKAVESAKNILFETEYVKQDISKEIQDSLQKVADETLKMVQGRSTESEEEFRTVINDIKSEFSKEASSKLEAIQKIAIDETEDFKQMLRRETIGSQMFVGEKINQDFQAALSELNDYKKIRMQEIDLDIQEIVRNVVKDVLETTMTLPIQEQLVVDALEKAKKEEVFKDLEEAGKIVNRDKRLENSAKNKEPGV